MPTSFSPCHVKISQVPTKTKQPARQQTKHPFGVFETTGFDFGFGLVDFSHCKAAYETPGSSSGLKLWLHSTLFQLKKTQRLWDRQSQKNVKPKPGALKPVIWNPLFF